MEHIPLFASNLFYSKIEDQNILDEVDTLSKNERYREMPNSDIGEDLRVLEKIPSSKSYLMNICDNLFKNTLMYEPKFEITTSWFTRTKTNHGSSLHNHRNCFYSAVFYFEDYEENTVGNIKFRSPISSFFNYDIVPTQWNIFNFHVWSIAPQKGLLLIFPSFVFHSITRHNTNNNRYSLAFNIVPVGEYGDSDSSYNSEWVS